MVVQLGHFIVLLLIFGADYSVQHSVATCIFASPCSGAISLYAGSYHSISEAGLIGGLLIRPQGSTGAYTRYNFGSAVAVSGTVPPGLPASACSFPCSGYTAASINMWQLATTPTLAPGSYEVTTTGDSDVERPIGPCLTSIINVASGGSLDCVPNQVQSASGPGSGCSHQLSFGPPTPNVNCPGATVTYSQISGPSSGTVVGIGVQTMTWQLFVNGNPGITCSHTVTVQDSSAPVLGACPNIQVPCQSGRSGGALVSFSMPSASDCSLVSFVATPVSGSRFSMGDTTTQIVATDSPILGSPSSASCNFNVKVVPAAAAYINGGGCPSSGTILLNVDNPNANSSTVVYPTPTFVTSCGDLINSALLSGPASGTIVNVVQQSSYPIQWRGIDPWTGAGLNCQFTVAFRSLRLSGPGYGQKVRMYTPVNITWQRLNMAAAELAGQKATLTLEHVNTGQTKSFGKISLESGTDSFRFSGFFGLTLGKYYLGVLPDSNSVTVVNNRVVIELIGGGY